MNNLQIDQKGIDLIKGFEGLKLTAYQDVAGVWTIGYGNTFYANGSKVKKGDMLVNEECAADLLLHTLKGFESQVNSLVKIQLTQNQFDALISFEYNTGSLAISTLLKKLNANDVIAASLEFAKWNKITDPATQKKVISDVLTKRRAKEQKLFLTQ